ncbi:MAG TPA: hypothetical protein VJ984_01060 [Xanthomonadales bacterium]|nr:hypothetical protein [Xanthomonadales bacterium]
MAAETGSIVTEEQREIRSRRTRAVRTAWILAVVALAIFVAFILSGVLGEPPA